MADTYRYKPASHSGERPYRLVQFSVYLDRLAVPVLHVIEGVVPEADSTYGLQVTELLCSVDMPCISKAEPFRDALTILAECPVEWGIYAREVRPVAREAPTLDKAEHPRSQTPTAVELLEGGQTFTADEQ